MAGALIVLAELAKSDLAWLDALRRRHYPPDRNRVPAHLTMFHALPPSAEGEVRRSLARAADGPPPDAVVVGPMDLGQGVALRVQSDELQSIHAELSMEFQGLLTAQDGGRFTPHVTIQNKVEERCARALLGELRRNFEPRPLRITGLRLVRYASGLWDPLACYSFRGS